MVIQLKIEIFGDLIENFSVMHLCGETLRPLRVAFAFLSTQIFLLLFHWFLNTAKATIPVFVQMEFTGSKNDFNKTLFYYKKNNQTKHQINKD